MQDITLEPAVDKEGERMMSEELMEFQHNSAENDWGSNHFAPMHKNLYSTEHLLNRYNKIK